MTTPRRFLTPALAAVALATAALATSVDACAREGIGDRAAGLHLGHHQHRLHLNDIRRHRHSQQRLFFTRFQPCVVWTREGWTDVCTVTR